jgi:hypothetical protein
MRGHRICEGHRASSSKYVFFFDLPNRHLNFSVISRCGTKPHDRKFATTWLSYRVRIGEEDILGRARSVRVLRKSTRSPKSKRHQHFAEQSSSRLTFPAAFFTYNDAPSLSPSTGTCLRCPDTSASMAVEGPLPQGRRRRTCRALSRQQQANVGELLLMAWRCARRCWMETCVDVLS